MQTGKFAARAAAVLLISFSAQADIISVSDTTTAWVDVLPAATTLLSIDNSSDPITARWGSPATSAGKSGFNFDNAATPFNVDTDLSDGRFFLGNFTHVNNPTFGTPPLSIGLSIDVGIDGVAGGFGEIFTLFLQETTNTAPAGCCDDFVTFSAGTTNSFFTLGGNDYFIRLLGFSNDGGATLLESFASQESGSNSTGLWGQIVEGRPTVTVAAPSTLFLLGGALFALAAVRLRG